MTPETLFITGTRVAMIGWLLLLFLPRWQYTTTLITSVILPVLLGGGYVFLMATRFPGSEGGFGSLEEVALFFEDPYLLVAGWVHYLAFDLFIGAWEVRDARRLGLHHLIIIPCLLLTFLAGPTGLLLYFILRWSLKRKALIGEHHAHIPG